LSLDQHLSLGQTFSSTVFSLRRYFIETATAGIDMLLQVLLHFCNNDGFAAISDVLITFCPLLND